MKFVVKFASFHPKEKNELSISIWVLKIAGFLLIYISTSVLGAAVFVKSLSCKAPTLVRRLKRVVFL